MYGSLLIYYVLFGKCNYSWFGLCKKSLSILIRISKPITRFHMFHGLAKCFQDTPRYSRRTNKKVYIFYSSRVPNENMKTKTKVTTEARHTVAKCGIKFGRTEDIIARILSNLFCSRFYCLS